MIAQVAWVVVMNRGFEISISLGVVVVLGGVYLIITHLPVLSGGTTDRCA